MGTLRRILWEIIKLPFNLLLAIIWPGKKDNRTKTGYHGNKRPPRV